MAFRLTAIAAAVLLAGCASTGTLRGEPMSHSAPPSAERAQHLLDARTRAQQAYDAGHYDEAAKLYTSLVSAMPGDADFWYRLGNALVRTERLEDAAFAYQRAVSIESSNERAWHNLGVVRMLQSQVAFAEAVKRSDPADRVFSESLRLSSNLYSLMERGVDPPAIQGRATSANAAPPLSPDAAGR